MGYGYGSSDHDHRDLERRLESKIDETRLDGQRDLRDLEERMYRMRQELTDYVSGQVEGLSEWIRDQAEHSHEQVPAKDGRP